MTDDDAPLDDDVDYSAPTKKEAPMSIEWSPQQVEALEAIRKWRNDVANGDAPQTFYLAGYAGTGKSTLAKVLGQMEAERGGHAQFCAYTGKAAVVLQRKGCADARTIHSVIYRSLDKSTEELDRLKEALAEAEKTDKYSAECDALREDIAREKEALSQPGFSLKEDFPQLWREDGTENDYGEPRRVKWKRITLFIVDEVSMVDDRLGGDLLSGGVPVLVLGDSAQLPPVRGSGFFTSRKPDVLLTEIHRQAAGNPIIDLASRVRRGERLEFGTFGESRVVLASELGQQDWLDADQILVGLNKTREAINKRCRVLLGFDELLPMTGEKLVCLRNNHDDGLLNGSLWKVVKSEDAPNLDTFNLTVESIDEPGRQVTCIAHKYPFFGWESPEWGERKRANEFTYGYALTVHKSQGSQWDNVVLMDEWKMQDSRTQWLYTGLTRAAQKITIVKR